jgi:hypothetical protein
MGAITAKYRKTIPDCRNSSPLFASHVDLGNGREWL